MASAELLGESDGHLDKMLRIMPDDPMSMGWIPKDQRPAKMVRPSPGYCLKTWTTDDQKVFVNVCHSKEIKPPEDISDKEMEKIWSDESYNFIIPIAIGQEKLATDNENIERATYDVLINTDYYEKCLKKETFMAFTNQVIIGSISEKYDKPLGTKFVMLKNKKVMGNLQTFRIEDREVRKPNIKKPLIEVLDNSSSSLNKLQSNRSSDDSFIFLNSESDKGSKTIVGYIKMPSMNMNNISVDVKSQRVLIEDKQANFFLDKFLPVAVDPDRVEADYESCLGILRLNMPVKTAS